MAAGAASRSLLPIPPMWLESTTSLELAQLLRSDVWRGKGVPHGDGGPVLLICGYLTGDPSLNAMAGWLQRIGHHPARAGLRWNVGCQGETVARLERRLEEIAEANGRKVAIVGQSRGGVCGRSLAIRRPDLVDRVIALGSPLRDPLDVHPAMIVNIRAVGLLGRLGVPGLFSNGCAEGDCCAQPRAELDLRVPDEVAYTSIYSTRDGIVRWRNCLDPDATHVRVDASHIGMAANAAVYQAIAEALAPEAPAATRAA